jgi:hypothetical protein
VKRVCHRKSMTASGNVRSILITRWDSNRGTNPIYKGPWPTGISLELEIGRVGFGFGSDQFDFLEENRVGSGQFICCFFRSLIDFDWIECHLISGPVSLTFLKNRIGSGSDPDESDRFLRSGRVL